jgi:hypothetical protein
MTGERSNGFEVFSLVLDNGERAWRVFMDTDQLLAAARGSELRARRPGRPASPGEDAEAPADEPHGRA